MKHGDVAREGDEFNRSTWYHCEKCGSNHAEHIPQCDGLRGGWLPPVPTGYVPRVPQMTVLEAMLRSNPLAMPPPPPVPTGYVPRVDPHLHAKANRPPRCPGCGVDVGAPHRPGCLQKVVDDYLLMERKARAWDELLVVLALNARDGCGASGRLLTHAETLVHPAHGSSTS